MALKDIIKGELLEIIEFNDDSRDTLAFRFPDDDREIKRGAQLIVRESQVAQFVYLGQFGDLFQPGKHRLTTDNLPVLATLKGWKYGFESPFKADVYFVTTRLFTGHKWGTSNPVMMRDEHFGVVRLRAFGTYDFRVTDVPRFLREVAGTDAHFRVDEFADTMRSRIVSVFSDALAASRIPALDVAGRYRELGDALLPLINPALQAKYGLELASFIVENVSVPAEVEQAIDKRSGMAAIGNLNDFVKYQMAHGFATSGSGAAALGAEMAIGLSMAQQMLHPSTGARGALSNVEGQQQPLAGSFAPSRDALAAFGDVLTPADAAKLLNVSEADVIASLEAGDLKGKKIGSQWRLTRAQLAQFMQ